MKVFIEELKSCCLLSTVHSLQVKMMQLLLLWIMMFLLQTGSSEDSLTPTKDVVLAVEGENATLSCRYSVSVDNLYWYQQKSGSSPQLLISEYSGNRDELSLIHQKERKEFHLEISSAALSDSAVYYCALQPTVTGNTNTLYKNLWSKDNTILHNSH
ncbi:uncharacterized protein V6R79_016663 [Siganus canaliculatus]